MKWIPGPLSQWHQKLRLEYIAHGHPASEGQSWDLNGHLPHSEAQALSPALWLSRVTLEVGEPRGFPESGLPLRLHPTNQGV